MKDIEVHMNSLKNLNGATFQLTTLYTFNSPQIYSLFVGCLNIINLIKISPFISLSVCFCR